MRRRPSLSAVAVQSVLSYWAFGCPWISGSRARGCSCALVLGRRGTLPRSPVAHPVWAVGPEGPLLEPWWRAHEKEEDSHGGKYGKTTDQGARDCTPDILATWSRGAQRDPNLDFGARRQSVRIIKLSSLKPVGSCLVTRVLLGAIEKHDGKSNAGSKRGQR